jgi:hypothetical protein
VRYLLQDSEGVILRRIVDENVLVTVAGIRLEYCFNSRVYFSYVRFLVVAGRDHTDHLPERIHRETPQCFSADQLHYCAISIIAHRQITGRGNLNDQSMAFLQFWPIVAISKRSKRYAIWTC